MDFTLSEEQLALKQVIKEFADNEIAPNAAKWDQECIFPIDAFQKSAEIGIGGLYTSSSFGGSMGGMISLAWLQMYPNDLENIFLVACSHKAYPINVFNRMIQREILKLDQDKSSGQKQGLKIARMLGYYNYRSNSELEDRFGNVNSELAGDRALADSEAYKNTELYNYFSYNADKFIKNFDADSYNVLLNAMDLFDLSKENAYHAAGYPSVNNECNIIVVGIDTDILFPIWQQQEIVDLLRACGYDPYFIEHVSPFGHDAFFIEHEAFSGYISRLLTKRKNKSGYKTRRARLS